MLLTLGWKMRHRVRIAVYGALIAIAIASITCRRVVRLNLCTGIERYDYRLFGLTVYRTFPDRQPFRSWTVGAEGKGSWVAVATWPLVTRRTWHSDPHHNLRLRMRMLEHSLRSMEIFERTRRQLWAGVAHCLEGPQGHERARAFLDAFQGAVIHFDDADVDPTGWSGDEWSEYALGELERIQKRSKTQ